MQHEMEILSNANLAYESHIREKDVKVASMYSEEVKNQYESKISVLGQELHNANVSLMFLSIFMILNSILQSG